MEIGYNHPTTQQTQKGTLNVITAGPSAGKTSTLRKINAEGYRVVPEAARLHIDQQISEGKNEEDIFGDLETFQEQVEEIDRYLEQQLEGGKTYFMDRALGDNIAYYRHNLNQDPEHIIEDVKGRYDNVFILEQLPFEDDYARQEDSKEAKQIHEEIIRGYRDAGYEPIFIELNPVDRRAEEIINEALTS